MSSLQKVQLWEMCWKEGEAEGGKDTAPYAPYHAASASVDPQAELSVEAKKQDEDNIKHKHQTVSAQTVNWPDDKI